MAWLFILQKPRLKNAVITFYLETRTFLRAFRTGVPDKAFSVEIARGIPFALCKQKGPFLALLFSMLVY